LVVTVLNMIGFFVLTGNQSQIFHVANKTKAVAEEVKEQAIVLPPPAPVKKTNH
jgi:hypothetical protein